MEIVRASQFDKIPLSQAQWNDLVNRSATNTPFQTYEWFSSWWSVFGNQYSLFILFGYREKTLIGIAPLMMEKNPKKADFRFVSDINADYCDFVVSKHYKESFVVAVLGYLSKHKNEWNSLVLQNIPQQSETLLLLKKHLPTYGFLANTSSVACPVLEIDKLDSIEQLTFSKTTRRHYNYFQKNGGLSFKLFESQEEAYNSLDLFFEQHINRWQLKNKKSLFHDNRYKNFYRRLLLQAWTSKWLFYSCLFFNGTPIAFHFGFDYNSSVIWYKPSFNINFRHRSPGTLMIKYLVEYCLQKKRYELDFSLGDERFKRAYATEIRYNHNIQILRSRWAYFFIRTNNYFRQAAKNFSSKFGFLTQDH